MSQFLGRQDCVESLRRDLIDLQGAILEVFSRTGPVRHPSWKFPDKLSCDLDLVSLLEQYDFVDGDDEYNQYSHIVLLELMIDRLLLLLQSFDVFAEQLRSRHRREHAQQKGCVSVGLVVRHYWNNLVQLGNPKGTCRDTPKLTKTKKFDCDETKTVSSASPVISSRSCPDIKWQSVLSSTSCCPQNHVNFLPSCPSHNVSDCSTDTCNASCQTVVSSLAACDACDQVQSVLKQTGDALVELCRSEGLPSSLQQVLVAVEDTLEVGHLTAGDIAQWAREQRRDMGRLGKYLREVRGTVQPLRDRLAVAERERGRFRSQLARAQEELKKEMAKHQASILQMEHALQEAHRSVKRLQEEQQQLKRGTLSLEDSNSRLTEELALQHETLRTLVCQKNELQEKEKNLQHEEEAHRKLQDKTKLLESQLSETQLLLDKERAKYQSACRQQESMQAKQNSLLERVDALDQECEELQRELGEGEDRQTDLQDQLKHMLEEKEQLLAQFTQQQALCSELQKEKQRLEADLVELKDSVAQLRREVQDLTQRERLLAAFPELNPVQQAQPQSTGNVLWDMEQQLQANCIRIRVLEQENVTLHSSLVKVRERAQHNATKA
ncbi:coiled-coil domain-containing protein 157 [Polymixia lowei]